MMTRLCQPLLAGFTQRTQLIKWAWGLLSLALLLQLSGCEGAVPAAPSPPPTDPPATTAAVSGPTAIVSVESPSARPDRQLLVWVPAFFVNRQDGTAEEAIADIYAQFERTHPGVYVELQVKEESGEASMLAYLRNAQRLAPTILPDLILLDTQQLWQAAELELLQPITASRLAESINFFPFTLNAATYNQQVIGVPYAVDLMHFVYHREEHENPPANWNELLARNAPYYFVLGRNESLSESLLIQYLGTGGQLQQADEPDQAEHLGELFSFAAAAKAGGIISEEILAATTPEQVWERFMATTAGFADTSAKLVLTQIDTLTGRNIGYSNIPTATGRLQTLGHVWAFAIITADPEQVQLAQDLIKLLLDPAIHATWGQETKYIPASITAFDRWRTANEYYNFLHSELEVAVALPNGRRATDFSKRLQQGYEKVIRGEMTVNEAVIYVQAMP